MNKRLWFSLPAALAAALAARLFELHTQFDVQTGLPQGCFLFLPAVLLVSAAVFFFLCRHLPASDKSEFRARFSVGGKLPPVLIVSGAFLLLFAAGQQFFSGSTLSAAVLVLSCAALLLAVYLLRQGADPALALLIPVCALVVLLVLCYRANANDPVLARFYPEILAFAALVGAFLLLVGFAFQNGKPRRFVTLAMLAVVLCVCAAAQQSSLPAALPFAAWIPVTLGFLSAMQTP